MGVRVHVGDHEEVGHALRRLKQQVQRHRAAEKWWHPAGQRWAPAVYVKPGDVRRAKAWRRWLGAWRAERRRAAGVDPWRPPW